MTLTQAEERVRGGGDLTPSSCNFKTIKALRMKRQGLYKRVH